MREVICDTSPLQYLHQLEQLELIPQLASPVLIPRAVAAELAAGLKLGIDLPDPSELDWATIAEPERSHDLRSLDRLGAGEAEVLALAVEKEAVAILDDRLARRAARALGVQLTGTLGLLLDAKRVGLIDNVAPLLDQLQSLRFRLASRTRIAVLRLADEDT